MSWRVKKNESQSASFVDGGFDLGFQPPLRCLQINKRIQNQAQATKFNCPFLEFHAQEMDSGLWPIKKTQRSWLAKLEISLKVIDVGSNLLFESHEFTHMLLRLEEKEMGWSLFSFLGFDYKVCWFRIYIWRWWSDLNSSYFLALLVVYRVDEGAGLLHPSLAAAAVWIDQKLVVFSRLVNYLIWV